MPRIKKQKTMPGKKTGTFREYVLSNKPVIAVLVVVAALILGAILFFGFPASVEKGDVVNVKYKAEFPNGPFIQEGNITFEAGTGRVIKGFDNAVLGMYVGQTKKISVAPLDAYGNYDFNLLEYIPRYYEMDLFKEVKTSELENATGRKIILNETLRLRNLDWPIVVKEITENTTLIKHMPVNGSTYYNILGAPFPIHFVDINNTNARWEYVATPGRDVRIGTKFGVVKEVTEDRVYIDYNHPLAGKTLIFTITVLSKERSMG